MKNVMFVCFLAALVAACVESKGEMVLVASYDCNDPVGSTTLTDSSGYGNNGTVSGATFNGSSMYLNGASYVTVADSDSLEPTNNQLSIEATVTPGTNVPVRTILSKWNSYYLRFNYDQISFGLFTVDESGVHENQLITTWNDPYITAGTTYNLVAFYDGTTATVYVNGVMKKEWVLNATLNTDSSSVLLLGAVDWGTVGNNNEFFYGSVDDVKIYNNIPEPTTLLLLLGGSLFFRKRRIVG